MMEPIYVLEPVKGIRDHERNGGIRFLRLGDEESLNAAQVFSSLNTKDERLLLDRFDYWLQGGIRDDYFHGFPNHPTYKHCYVFKWKKKRVGHRLYGFICNPHKARPRFRLCVLVSHSTKTTWETDPEELAGAEAIRVDPRVQRILELEFFNSTVRH